MTAALQLFGARATDHLPENEAGLRDLLAGCLRETLDLDRSSVMVEARRDGKFLDIWVQPLKLAVEVKYHRGVPSGWNRPMTLQFGDLLSDIRKLSMGSDSELRLLVLVADPAGVTHIRNKDLLPIDDPSSRLITVGHVAGLATTASRRAVANGPWLDVSVRRVWQSQIAGGFQGIAWETNPV